MFFEPEENHWHSAAPNRFMTHIAMQQNDESGSPVTWGRHITNEEYGTSPTKPSWRHYRCVHRGSSDTLRKPKDSLLRQAMDIRRHPRSCH